MAVLWLNASHTRASRRLHNEFDEIWTVAREAVVERAD